MADTPAGGSSGSGSRGAGAGGGQAGGVHAQLRRGRMGRGREGGAGQARPAGRGRHRQSGECAVCGRQAQALPAGGRQARQAGAGALSEPSRLEIKHKRGDHEVKLVGQALPELACSAWAGGAAVAGSGRWTPQTGARRCCCRRRCAPARAQAAHAAPMRASAPLTGGVDRHVVCAPALEYALHEVSVEVKSHPFSPSTTAAAAGRW